MKQVLGILLTVLFFGSIISCSISEVDSTTDPTRENRPATLSSNKRLLYLGVSQGVLNFNNEIPIYNVIIPNTFTTYNLTPIAEDNRTTILVNGTEVLSGSTSFDIPLSQGDNTITVEVIAEDGNYTEFIITVTTVLVNELFLGADYNDILNPGDKVYYSFIAVLGKTYNIFAKGDDNMIAGYTTAIKVSTSNELSNGIPYFQELTGTINKDITPTSVGKIYIFLSLDDDTRSGGFNLKVTEF